MLVILLTILLVLVCAYDLSVRSGRVWRMLSSQFPGEPALPLVGNALQLGTTSDGNLRALSGNTSTRVSEETFTRFIQAFKQAVQHNLRRIWEKHGRKNFRVVFGTDPMLLICDADDVKLILGSNVEIQKSDQHIHTLKEHFGDSLVNSTGERWRVMRKILTPSFHFKLLDHYLELANDESNMLVARLRQYVDKPAFDIHHILGLYTMNVTCRASMGLSVNENLEGEKYINANRKILPLCIKRFYSAWYRHDFLYKHSALGKEGQKIANDIEVIVDQIIAHRRREFDKNIKPIVSSDEDVEKFISKNRNDLTLIDVMLLSKMPDGSPIPNEYIREETHVMVFAGYDTTVTTLSFTLCAFAKYKELQDRAYEEQLEIFGNDLTREATSQDLNNMKYLQRFIKETMRMFPTLAQFGRHINNDLKLSDGKVIPAGTNIIFYVPGLHMNAKYFPNPEKFDPDRFLQPIPIYTYLPFSAGPRNCIGMNFAWMSMRSVLSKILRNFELSLESPQHEPQPVNEFILTSRNGYIVKLTERRKNYP